MQDKTWIFYIDVALYLNIRQTFKNNKTKHDLHVYILLNRTINYVNSTKIYCNLVQDTKSISIIYGQVKVRP